MRWHSKGFLVSRHLAISVDACVKRFKMGEHLTIYIIPMAMSFSRESFRLGRSFEPVECRLRHLFMYLYEYTSGT